MSKQKTKKPSLLPVRAAMAGFPIATIAVLYLWVTGYPPEDWAFVGGVLYLCLFGSGILVAHLALIIARRLDQYGRRVASDRGIDIDQPRMPDPARAIAKSGIMVCILVLLMGTIWGLALSFLNLVISNMELAPLDGNLGTVAIYVLLIGFCGLSLVFSMSAAIFYLASEGSRGIWLVLMRARTGAMMVGLELGASIFGGPQSSRGSLRF